MKESIKDRNILILNHYATRPNDPGGSRHYALARGLIKDGWKVTICASTFDHFLKKQRFKDVGLYHNEEINKVSYQWIKTISYKNNSIFRIMGMLQFSIQSFLRNFNKKKFNYDFIIGSSVHPFTVFSAFLLSKRHGVNFAFEIRDLWPETLIQIGSLSRNSFVCNFLFKLEKFLSEKAALIIGVLPNIDEYLIEKSIDFKKFIWVPNGVMLDYFPLNPYPYNNKKFTVTYFGSVGNANGLDTIVDSMQYLKEQDLCSEICLRIIGSGPLLSKIKKQASELISNEIIVFDEPVPKNLISEACRDTNAFILHFLDRPILYKYGVSPNKIFDYMACCRPIIIAASIPNNYVSDADCGVVCKPEDPKKIAEVIYKLSKESSNDLEDMSLRGREFVGAHFSMDVLAKKLGKSIERLI